VLDGGTLVFSKQTLNRFPEEGEVLSLLRASDR